MLKIEDYALYSLEEIKNEPNEIIKHQIIVKRQEMLMEMATNRLIKQIIQENYNASIIKIDELIQTTLLHHTSNSLFEENQVILYPQIREVKASKEIVCDISGGIIRTGSYYLNYQAFLDNLSTGKCYVLRRPWLAEMGNYNFFPTNMYELDMIDINLKNAYNSSNNIDYGQYDYYSISTRIGEGVQLRMLGPRKLKK